MKIEINIERKYFIIGLGVTLAILGLLVFVVATVYNSPIPNQGHDGDEILVYSKALEKTIQQAIDDDDFRGFPGSTGATGNPGSAGPGDRCRLCQTCGGGYSQVGSFFLWPDTYYSYWQLCNGPYQYHNSWQGIGLPSYPGVATPTLCCIP